MAHFTPDKQLMESSLHALPTSDLEVNWRQQNQDGTDGLQYVSSIPLPQSKLVTSLPTTSRRILGLSVGMFWVVVAVIVLVFAGGIRGGVAGGVTAQKNSCSQSQQSAAIATPISMPRATSISASSTSLAAPAGASPQIGTPCTGNNAANGSTLVAHDPTAANTALASVPINIKLSPFISSGANSKLLCGNASNIRFKTEDRMGFGRAEKSPASERLLAVAIFAFWVYKNGITGLKRCDS